MEETQKINKPFPIVPIIIGIIVLGFVVSTISKMMFRSRVKTLSGGIVDVKNGDEYQVKTKEGELVVSQEKGLDWPSELPVNIPKYNDGKVKAYSHVEGQMAWSIVISDTTEDSFKDYKELLIKDGWTEGSEMIAVVSMIQMKKDDFDVNVIWDGSSNGVVITLSKNL